MKKLITLSVAIAAFVAVHAQTDREEARRVILGQEKKTTSTTSRNERDVILGGGNETTYPNTYPSGSKREQVDQVNREYDAKIATIRNNRFLSAEQKARMIRELEQERSRRIREINQSSGEVSKKNKKYDEGYGKTKGNNGKHLGWEKGKGNPHKNGGKPGKGKG